MTHMNMGGERQQFKTGAQRDTDHSKPLFGRIPVWRYELLERAWTGARHMLKINRDRPGTETLKVDPELVRLELIPAYFLRRLAQWLAMGAARYGDYNWQKGMPLSRYLDSLERHIKMLRAGDTSEDHWAAIAFNGMAGMWTEATIATGDLPAELGDAGWMNPQPALQDVEYSEIQEEMSRTRYTVTEVWNEQYV